MSLLWANIWKVHNFIKYHMRVISFSWISYLVQNLYSYSLDGRHARIVINYLQITGHVSFLTFSPPILRMLFVPFLIKSALRSNGLEYHSHAEQYSQKMIWKWNKRKIFRPRIPLWLLWLLVELDSQLRRTTVSHRETINFFGKSIFKHFHTFFA